MNMNRAQAAAELSILRLCPIIGKMSKYSDLGPHDFGFFVLVSLCFIFASYNVLRLFGRIKIIREDSVDVVASLIKHVTNTS